nr:hypothetical protein [uncultured Carboxylicivirga sp.]
MKKYLFGLIVLAFAMQLKATDKVKVFNIQKFNEPVLSVINTEKQFDYLVIKETKTNKVLLEKNVSKKLNIHERLDFVEGGAKNYTVELVSKTNHEKSEYEVVNNFVIQNIVEMSDNGTEDTKMFVLDDETLLVSHINGDRNPLCLVIEDVDTNKRLVERTVGKDRLFSRKQDIVRLKKGNSYRATLYSGDTAYVFNFVK